MYKGKTTIVYPGSFDPITNGHTDLVQRAAKIFDEVIIAVAAESSKSSTFALDKRVELAKNVTENLSNVVVEPFSGLLIDYLKKQNLHIVLRGLRAVSDFEYEIQLASVNRSMYNKMETVFLTPSEQFTYISSSLVKQIADLDGDVSAFVDPKVAQALLKRG